MFELSGVNYESIRARGFNFSSSYREFELSGVRVIEIILYVFFLSRHSLPLWNIEDMINITVFFEETSYFNSTNSPHASNILNDGSYDITIRSISNCPYYVYPMTTHCLLIEYGRICHIVKLPISMIRPFSLVNNSHITLYPQLEIIWKVSKSYPMFFKLALS